MVLLVQIMGIATIQDVKNYGGKTMSDVVNAEVDLRLTGQRRSLYLSQKIP